MFILRGCNVSNINKRVYKFLGPHSENHPFGPQTNLLQN